MFNNPFNKKLFLVGTLILLSFCTSYAFAKNLPTLVGIPTTPTISTEQAKSVGTFDGNILDPGSPLTPWGGCGPQDANCYIQQAIKLVPKTKTTKVVEQSSTTKPAVISSQALLTALRSLLASPLPADILNNLRGPQGLKGDAGVTIQSSSPSPSIYIPGAVIPTNPSTYYAGGSLFSATDLSSTNFITKNALVTDLTVANIITGNITGNAGTVTNGVYTNASNTFSLINPLITPAESWIGPSSTNGIYFQGGRINIGTTDTSVSLPKSKMVIMQGDNDTSTGAYSGLTVNTNSSTEDIITSGYFFAGTSAGTHTQLKGLFTSAVNSSGIVTDIVGAYSQGVNISTATNLYSADFSATNIGNTTNLYGINSSAQNYSGATATNLYAVKAVATNSGTVTTSYGIYASSTGSTTNWAGYFDAGNVYIKNNLGVGTLTSSDKLEVNGNIRITAGSGGTLIFADGSVMTSAGLGSASSLTNPLDVNIVGDSDVNGTGAIIFKTGNTEKMRMLNNGNIGIGTNAPTATLTFGSTGTSTINSFGALTINSAATTALTIDSGTTGAINLGTGSTAKTITIGNGTGATALTFNGGTGAISIGTNAIAHTITLGNSTGATSVVLNSGTGAINIGTNAIAHTVTVGNTTGASAVAINTGTGNFALNISQLFVNKTSGNVGIGTITPAYLLDVNGAINATSLKVNGVDVATSSDTYWNSATGGITYGTNVNVNGLYLGDGGTTGIKILASGNVGIGTTTPTYTLDVNGVINATALKVNGVDVATSSDSFWSSATGGINYAGGNVGIGTTTPANKLDVVGDINVSSGSAYKINGVNVVTAQTALDNYFFGGAGNSTMTGIQNTATGYQALYSNITGYQNIAIGYQVLSSNTTGGGNTATGYQVLSSNTTGGQNTAIGSQALTSNTTGYFNTAIGDVALSRNTTGYFNTAIGDSALFRNTTGYFNTANGYWALGNNVTGSNNVALGYSAGKYETGSSAFYVDAFDRTNTAGDKAKALMYGTFATTAAAQTLKINAVATIDQNLIVSGTGNSSFAGNVGIGTTTPAYKLDVNGTVNATALMVNGVAVGTSSDTYWTPISGGISYGSNVNVSGNTNVLGTMGVGTASPVGLFDVNGKFTVLANGNVGIGTTTPTSMFQVTFGSISSNNNIIIGYNNTLNGASLSSVLGGFNGITNASNLDYGSSIVGGVYNSITTSGIYNNTGRNTIVGGGNNSINITYTSNSNNGYSFIGSGEYNSITASHAVIPGGSWNTVSGIYGFATGRRAKATAQGVFAISDSTNADFTVGTADVFGARYSGGYWLTGGNVGIGNTTPTFKLDVSGVVRVYKGAAGGTITPSTLAGIVIENSDDVSLQLFSPTDKMGIIQFGSSINGAQGRIAYQSSSNATTDYMSFDIVGTEKMRIDVDGNLGLNTTTPTEALDLGSVGADIAFSDITTYHQIITGGTTDLALMPGGKVGIGTTTPTTKLDVVGTINATGLTINGVPVATSSDTYWNAVAGGISYTAGNVGIGTATPVSKLHLGVAATATANYGTLSIGSGAFDGATLGYFVGSASGTQIAINAGTGFVGNLLDLQTAGVRRLVVTGAGNVGIGTTTPTSPLDVNGDIRIHTGSGGTLIFADGTTMSTANVGSADSLSNASDAVIWADSDASDAGDIIFKTDGSEKMRISNTGILTLSNGSLYGSQINWGTGLGAITHLLGPTDAVFKVTSYLTNAFTIDSGSTGAINIGTSAFAKTITIGNATGATSLVLNGGTGAMNIGTSIAKTITIGNGTGATSVVLNSGTGAINIGTNAIAHTITLGNSTGATSVVLNSGTGAINIGTNAIAHTVTIGNVTTTTAVNINTGTGNFALNTSQLFVNQTSGNVGIGTITPSYLLHVGSTTVVDATVLLRLQDADSTCDFTANLGAPACGSDETLKKNIVSLSGNLEKISALRPITYNWLTDTDDTNIKHGFIAQEVATIMPELVTDGIWIDGTTKKFLQIEGMIPYMVGAIKEMNLGLTLPDAPLTETIDGVETKTFAGKFFDRLSAWLANAENKITRIFTGEVCLTEAGEETVCINRAELKSLKALLNQSSGSSSSGSSSSSESSESTVETPVIETPPEEILPTEEIPVEDTTPPNLPTPPDLPLSGETNGFPLIRGNARGLSGEEEITEPTPETEPVVESVVEPVVETSVETPTETPAE